MWEASHHGAFAKLAWNPELIRLLGSKIDQNCPPLILSSSIFSQRSLIWFSRILHDLPSGNLPLENQHHVSFWNTHYISVVIFNSKLLVIHHYQRVYWYHSQHLSTILAIASCWHNQRNTNQICLVGGLEDFWFSHILGIIIPIDELIFFKGVQTTSQCIIIP